MGTAESDAELVGLAEGLLADDQTVWIARHGVEQRFQIKNIFVTDKGIVRADLSGSGKSILLAPGELAMVVTNDL